MQIDFFFFPLWVFKCKKGEISLCTPMPELRTERSHSSFQCAWKESAELGHQMSKKLRFFVRPSWPRPEQKNHQSLEKMCFVQNSETYIKNVLKAILSSKDMNKYVIRPSHSSHSHNAKSTISLSYVPMLGNWKKFEKKNLVTIISALFTKQSVKWQRRFNRIL